MLSLPPAVRIFVCTQLTDMRYGFDRLAMLAETILKQDPFSGHLFVFFNRPGDRCKILFWHAAVFVFGISVWSRGYFDCPGIQQIQIAWR